MFDKIISLENLFGAWREFKRGKSRRLDVCLFELNLEDNLFKLHRDLKNQEYRHSPYDSFYITDPKLRHIHKAIVRDRLVHQAIYRVLYPFFDKQFIFDSYSCRLNKGVHGAIGRLNKFLRQASQNKRREVFVLKCDVRKFFDSIDQTILFKLLKRKIKEEPVWRLLRIIINSYSIKPGLGIPLGNVTSQLFANIYLNELDQFIKHKLKIQHYLRYCDDFAIMHRQADYLNDLIYVINYFLEVHLRLALHPNKIVVRKFSQGIDFLGYVTLPRHLVLRSKTKKRMLKKIHLAKDNYQKGILSAPGLESILNSYYGILGHCSGFQLKNKLTTLAKIN